MNRVLIWGTGNMAQKLIEYGVNAEIVGFIQTVKCIDKYNGYPVFSPEECVMRYDYILVANTFGDEIRVKCEEIGINLDSVVFLFKGKTTEWRISQEIKSILGEANLTRYCAEYGALKDSFYEHDKSMYEKINKRNNFKIDDSCLWPIITDKYDTAGTVGNYFWQDLWAAKKIIKSDVKNHFDIGSRLDGFIAHLLSANIDVTMIDIREFPCEIKGLYTLVDDATTLHQVPDESIMSLSALCSLEHFGLGRYGDPIDPEACFNCFSNIQRKMKKGGNLYISVPIGRERVEFNAHRVFYAETIVGCFDEMSLVEFSATTVSGIEYNPDIHKFDSDSHNGEHRYGLFHFCKNI